MKNTDKTNLKEKRRVRRKNEDIEKCILLATKELVAKGGFKDLTINAITQKAKVETIVFYNRYSSLDKLLERFVREYDYWLGDSVHFDPKNLDLKQNNENILFGLIDSINSNEIMQQLLVWELSEKNHITEITAESRELHSKRMIKYFSENYKDTDIDICAISALFIGGIYFLAMHKHVSTFCLLDFNKQENIELLKKSIRGLLNKMYDNREDKDKMDIEVRKAKEIAQNMLDNNMEESLIMHLTGLTKEQLKSIGSDDITKKAPMIIKRKRGRPKKNN